MVPIGMLTSVLEDPSKGSNSSMYFPCGQFSERNSGFSISSEASAQTNPVCCKTLISVSFAMVVEQAGGRASTGVERILAITPEALHQRVPLLIGSGDDVAMAEAFIQGKR